jgi:hypothetical protein
MAICYIICQICSLRDGESRSRIFFQWYIVSNGLLLEHISRRISLASILRTISSLEMVGLIRNNSLEVLMSYLILVIFCKHMCSLVKYNYLVPFRVTDVGEASEPFG